MTPGYVLRRLAQVPLAVAGILAITFVILHLAPGDPVAALAGEGADPEYTRQVRARFGLDRPLPQQFVAYASHAVRGDLGTSIVRGQPVAAVIGDRLPSTLLLMGSALTLIAVGGVGIGVLGARRPNGPLDLTLTGGALVGYATPTFWMAQLALFVLGLRLGLFPIQGMTDARSTATGLPHVLDVARHLVLPAAVLAVSEVALVSRLTRSGLVGELAKHYVRTAQAVGIPRRRLLVRHVLPNALLPVVTVLGTRVGTLFSGALLVEIVFAWPGLGRLLVGSTQTRDYPVLLGLVLLAAFAVVVAHLVTDLVYGAIDPRVRYD